MNTSGTLKVVENEERSTTQLRINSEDDYEESDGEDKEKRTKVNVSNYKYLEFFCFFFFFIQIINRNYLPVKIEIFIQSIISFICTEFQ